MGNCCGSRRFPFTQRIAKRCNTSSKDDDTGDEAAAPTHTGGSSSHVTSGADGTRQASNHADVSATHPSQFTSQNGAQQQYQSSSASGQKRNGSSSSVAGATGGQPDRNNNKKSKTKKTLSPTSYGSRHGESQSSQNPAFRGDGESGATGMPLEMLVNEKPIFDAAIIQHIRDREEPEELDVELHPSDLSTPSTFFLSKALEDNRKLTANKKDDTKTSKYVGSKAHKRYSSCSTIMIDDSTVSHPNQRAMVKCVSLAIYYHIRHRKHDKTGKNFYAQFDEKRFPLTKDKVPDDYDRKEPDHKIIYRFIRQFFTSAQLNAECAIVMLVYLERLMTYGELRMQPSNWKRVVLGAILLASKVWDDQAVWNVDYCQILQELSVDDMNALERHYLELLQFNINVGSSIYAKYYFDLRQLAAHAGLYFNTLPLTIDRAKKLEASSRLYEQKLRDDKLLGPSSGDAKANNNKQQSSKANAAESQVTKNKNAVEQQRRKKLASKLLLHRSNSAEKHLEQRTVWYVCS